MMKTKNPTSIHVPGQTISIDAWHPNDPGGVAMQRVGTRIGAVKGMRSSPLNTASSMNFLAMLSTRNLPPRSLERRKDFRHRRQVRQYSEELPSSCTNAPLKHHLKLCSSPLSVGWLPPSINRRIA